jgi:indolepyruvate ferredoxin oxidoreductase beta subunit
MTTLMNKIGGWSKLFGLINPTAVGFLAEPRGSVAAAPEPEPETPRKRIRTIASQLPENLHVLITGIGGQGVVGLSGRLRDVLAANYPYVYTSEQRGVAQRRASTGSTVIASKQERAPSLNLPEVDILIGLEPLEALRASERLLPGSWCLLSDVRVETIAGGDSRFAYADTENILQQIEQRGVKCILLPLAEWHETNRMEPVYASSAMLGAFCAAFGHDLQAAKALFAKKGSRAPDKNIQALEWGHGYMKDVLASAKLGAFCAAYGYDLAYAESLFARSGFEKALENRRAMQWGYEQMRGVLAYKAPAMDFRTPDDHDPSSHSQEARSASLGQAAE